MTAIAKFTQAETACQLIRAEILEGRLLPGGKLNIKALEQRFEVSLGAIREALSRIAATASRRSARKNCWTSPTPGSSWSRCA
jgi:DNA-binding GntR family transcriptional regulator